MNNLFEELDRDDILWLENMQSVFRCTFTQYSCGCSFVWTSDFLDDHIHLVDVHACQQHAPRTNFASKISLYTYIKSELL